MKKTTLLLASLAILAIGSCGDEKEPETQVIERTETTVIEKEVPAPAAQAPAAEPAPAPEEDNDGTSISVGSDGVEISTKDGNNKTDINLKKGGGSLKIEK